MVMLNPDSAVLYFMFHLLYLGHPSRMLRKLWIALDEAEAAPPTMPNPWNGFSETIKESYRGTAVLAALIASAAGALLATSASENAVPRTLLLGSLTCSILAASSSASLLSAMMFSSNPSAIVDIWSSKGIKFLILLSTPAGWFSNSLLAFEAALLAIVWANDTLAAKIVVTTLIGFSSIMAFALPISMFGMQEEFQHLLGIHESANHRILLPSAEAREIRQERLTRKRGTNDATKFPVGPNAHPIKLSQTLDLSTSAPLVGVASTSQYRPDQTLTIPLGTHESTASDLNTPNSSSSSTTTRSNLYAQPGTPYDSSPDHVGIPPHSHTSNLQTTTNFGVADSLYMMNAAW